MELIQNSLERQKGKPRIVPRSEHPISRSSISREALSVLYELKRRGYLAYLVGGSVRDLLLGLNPKDFDVGTDARPEEIRKIFKRSKIIGRRFRLVHVYFRGGKVVEVITFRGPEERDDRPENYGTPEEDAFRRDLTINALFYNISDFTIIDYVGGLEDLREGIIRVIGDPAVRFSKDPVRILRAVRHAARTGFRIEERTWEGILSFKDRLKECSSIRIRDEWMKDIGGGWASEWLRLSWKAGVFEELFPSYEKKLRERPELKNFLLRLLKFSDELAKKGTLTQSQALTLFLYPYVVDLREGLPKRPKRNIEEVRIKALEILGSSRFCRELLEETVLLLSALTYLRYFFYAGGSVPKKLRKKSYFFLVREIFETVFSEEKSCLKIELRPKKKKRK